MIVPVVAVGAAVYGLARWFEWKNLYRPAQRIEMNPGSLGLEYEDVWFVAEDAVRLHGWWIPAEDAVGTIVYCHGNAGNIGDRVEIAADLRKLGVNVFLFDYRGYGQSKGIATEQGTYRDARAAFEVARYRHGDADNPPILVYGSSLGGAIAVQLALDKPARGLVLEGTFTSATEMGERMFPGLPIRWINRYRYNSLSKIASVTCPLVLAHSRKDQLIPYEMGQRLFRAATAPKRMVTLECDHGESGWSYTPRFWTDLQELVARTLGTGNLPPAQ